MIRTITFLILLLNDTVDSGRKKIQQFTKLLISG